MFDRFKAYLSRRKAHKEWKKEMNDILRGTNFVELALLGRIAVDVIFEATKLIAVTTFSILKEKYRMEMDSYTAQVLASQVTNYLTGQSIEQAYQRSEEPLKSVIGRIKDIVHDKAIEIMNNDIEVREMIIMNLHFVKHIDWSFKETSEYLSPSQKAQIEDLLNKFGEGISYDLDLELDHEKFLILAKNFRIKRLKG
jgi:hypothetical protein